jgi:response regulator of citrate/malate metabolism
VKPTDPSCATDAERVAREVPVSFRELTMIEVREVIRRWQAGEGLREMSRGTGLDRKTIRRYIEAIGEVRLEREGAVDDTLVHEVGRRVQARPMLEPSLERTLLQEHRGRIEQWPQASLHCV